MYITKEKPKCKKNQEKKKTTGLIRFSAVQRAVDFGSIYKSAKHRKTKENNNNNHHHKE